MTSRYYDYRPVLDRNADITMVVSARGLGKTYGIRLEAIKDWIKHGYTFVEVSRFKTETEELTETYFDRIVANDEFPRVIFKTTRKYGYAFKIPKGKTVEDYTEGDLKPEWEIICYFVSLTEEQKIKKRTFKKVRKIIMDEAVLNKRTKRFVSYLQNEMDALASVIDSCSRERPEDEGKPQVFLLANACDLMNPYFRYAGITKLPDYGLSWHRNKTFLLDYVDASEYSKEKAKDTVAGRILSNSQEGNMAIFNDFLGADDKWVMKKTPTAKFRYAFIFERKTVALWMDYSEGWAFLTSKAPKNTQEIYALTRDDMTLNVLIAKNKKEAIKLLYDLFSDGVMRFDSLQTQETFFDICRAFNL